MDGKLHILARHRQRCPALTQQIWDTLSQESAAWQDDPEMDQMRAYARSLRLVAGRLDAGDDETLHELLARGAEEGRLDLNDELINMIETLVTAAPDLMGAMVLRPFCMALYLPDGTRETVEAALPFAALEERIRQTIGLPESASLWLDRTLRSPNRLDLASWTARRSYLRDCQQALIGLRQSATLASRDPEVALLLPTGEPVPGQSWLLCGWVSAPAATGLGLLSIPAPPLGEVHELDPKTVLSLQQLRDSIVAAVLGTLEATEEDAVQVLAGFYGPNEGAVDAALRLEITVALGQGLARIRRSGPVEPVAIDLWQREDEDGIHGLVELLGEQGESLGRIVIGTDVPLDGMDLQGYLHSAVAPLDLPSGAEWRRGQREGD